MGVQLGRICNPGQYPLDDAIQRTERLAEAQPGFELKLVRYLQLQCLNTPVPIPNVLRGLDLLGALLKHEPMDEKRVISLLRPFLTCGEPQIASKCVLVLGRKLNSLDWIGRMMAENDDRFRANLIQALWKRKEPEIQRVLVAALHDPHPRVMANAVYGLFVLGAADWLDALEKLLGSDNPDFRICGIWVLKASCAREAPELIRRFIRDPNARVRRAAFDALIALRGHGGNRIASTITH